MFSFRSFMVSGLIFKSLTHFELIFVSAVRQWSNFLVLHVFPQHYLLKDYPFPVGYSWLPCWILVDHICQGLISGSLFCSAGFSVYLCASIILLLLLWLCSIVQIREYDTSRFVLFSQDCFGYWGLLQFHTNFRIVSFTSVKKDFCILMGITLNL